MNISKNLAYAFTFVTLGATSVQAQDMTIDQYNDFITSNRDQVKARIEAKEGVDTIFVDPTKQDSAAYTACFDFNLEATAQRAVDFLNIGSADRGEGADDSRVAYYAFGGFYCIMGTNDYALKIVYPVANIS